MFSAFRLLLEDTVGTPVFTHPSFETCSRVIFYVQRKLVHLHLPFTKVDTVHSVHRDLLWLAQSLRLWGDSNLREGNKKLKKLCGAWATHPRRDSKSGQWYPTLMDFNPTFAWGLPNMFWFQRMVYVCVYIYIIIYIYIYIIIYTIIYIYNHIYNHIYIIIYI